MVFVDKYVNKKMTPFFVEYSFLLNHVERFPNSLIFSQYVEIIQFWPNLSSLVEIKMGGYASSSVT